MSESKTTVGCPGCGSFVVTVLILWALWFGLPTPWGTFNTDIFPPQIREVTE
jgi:hypothetical protein